MKRTHVSKRLLCNRLCDESKSTCNVISQNDNDISWWRQKIRNVWIYSNIWFSCKVTQPTFSQEGMLYFQTNGQLTYQLILSVYGKNKTNYLSPIRFSKTIRKNHTNDSGFIREKRCIVTSGYKYINTSTSLLYYANLSCKRKITIYHSMLKYLFGCHLHYARQIGVLLVYSFFFQFWRFI